MHSDTYPWTVNCACIVKTVLWLILVLEIWATLENTCTMDTFETHMPTFNFGFRKINDRLTLKTQQGFLLCLRVINWLIRPSNAYNDNFITNSTISSNENSRIKLIERLGFRYGINNNEITSICNGHYVRHCPKINK